MMTREELAAIVVTRMFGSAEPAHHTHIECQCPGGVHRADQPDEGCFCPECAAKEAVRRGFNAKDIEPESEGPEDNPSWCESCGRLITLRTTPELLWGITPRGALEELEHFESGLGAERGEPKTPDDWRLFLLLVDNIDEEHLPRVEALLWARPSPVTIERIAALIGAELVRRGMSVAIGPLGQGAMSSDGLVLESLAMVGLRWDRENATITVDTGTMFDRVLTLPMAERFLARLTASWVAARRTRCWLLDMLDGECRETTGHHLGLRSYAFHAWKGAPDVR